MRKWRWLSGWLVTSDERWLRKRRCPHSSLQGVYGDMINAVGGWRLICKDCRRFLDGPVSLVEARSGEHKLYGSKP